ncbi:MAG: host attachment protein [Myxococcales bacterium]|nr:host attachment protein [Myxococcales bacterium]
MQQFTSTWVVVADAQRARVLYLERPGAPVRRVFEEEDAPRRRFAVADVVNEVAANEGFDHLILVASPSILDDLKDALSEPARGRIEAECPQDLSRFSDEMVLRVLGDMECEDSLLGDADDVRDDDDDDAAGESTSGGRQVQGSLQ